MRKQTWREVAAVIPASLQFISGLELRSLWVPNGVMANDICC